jgi:hypothetical protein
LVANAGRNGGVTIFVHGDKDVAVAVVNPRLNVLLVLNVLPEHRAHGLGSAIVRYLQCNFARVIDSAVPFFRKCGYVAVGESKLGNRYQTQVMVKSSLISLAGRLARLNGLPGKRTLKKTRTAGRRRRPEAEADHR